MRSRTVLALAIAVSLMSTSASFATNLSRCQNLPDIVTPNDAPVNRIGVATSGVGSGFAGGGRQLGLCSNPDHPWHDAMKANGLCELSGNLATLAQPVATGAYKYVTFDGDIPDVLVHQTGKVNVKQSAKESAKASLEATKNAPENQGKPIWEWTPHIVVVEVVDWNNPVQGSSCN